MFIFHVPFLRKLLKDVPHRNKGVNQGRRRHGIQKTGALTPERGKGNLQYDEGRSQHDSPKSGTAGNQSRL